MCDCLFKLASAAAPHSVILFLSNTISPRKLFFHCSTWRSNHVRITIIFCPLFKGDILEVMETLQWPARKAVMAAGGATTQFGHSAPRLSRSLFIQPHKRVRSSHLRESDANFHLLYLLLLLLAFF